MLSVCNQAFVCNQAMRMTHDKPRQTNDQMAADSPRFSFSMRSLLTVIVLLALVVLTWKLSRDLSRMKAEVDRLETLLYENQTIQIEYGRFLLVEVGSHFY